MNGACVQDFSYVRYTIPKINVFCWIGFSKLDYKIRERTVLPYIYKNPVNIIKH